jgi:peptide/nickel transport system permease protein
MTRRAAALIAMLAIAAWLLPWLAPYDPEEQHREYLFAPPMPPRLVQDGSLRAPFAYGLTLADRLGQRYETDLTERRPLPWFGGRSSEPVFLLGADSFGRDLLSRLLHGARVSIGLALTAVIGALLVGIGIGGVAGYRDGWLDELSMRAADFVLVLPVIYVVLVLRALLPLVLAPETVFVLMTAIFTLVGWPFVARGVRGILAIEREREYVAAARALGASGTRIVLRHLLPACGGHVLTQATLLMPAFILAEATLSYVGLGFPEQIATWGTMLREAANLSAMTRFPWTLTPALAIFAVVFSANVILQSDGIGDQPISHHGGAPTADR